MPANSTGAKNASYNVPAQKYSHPKAFHRKGDYLSLIHISFKADDIPYIVQVSLGPLLLVGHQIGDFLRAEP